MLDTTKTTNAPARVEEPKAGVDWLLIGAVAIAIVTLAVVVWQSLSSETASSTADQVSGFEYSTEATSGRVASEGVTTQYFGNTDELWPIKDRIEGFEYHDEATTGKVLTGRVTTNYLGYSPELDPEK